MYDILRRDKNAVYLNKRQNVKYLSMRLKCMVFK